MLRIKTLLALLLAFGLLAAACGSDDDDGEASTTTTAATDEEGDEAADESGDETADESGDEAADEEMTDDAAAHSCDPASFKTEGQLTVATGDAVFPPWVLNDDPAGGEGFEAALVVSLASELGIDAVQWSGTTFDEAIAPGPKDYDFNIQQYSITPDRDEVVDFSDGYYEVEQAIIGAADSPAASATSVADLAELRLGAAIGTTSLDYIETVIEPSTQAAVYDDNAAAKAAFDAGQVDAIVFDLPTAYFITAVEIPDASIIGVLPRVGDDPEELGMLFEDGSPLVGCINEALAALDADGTLADLEERWLSDGGNIPELAA